MSEKITYDDLKRYEHLFTMAPSFMLGAMARRNSNLVSKFEFKIKSTLVKLNDVQKEKLNALLNADISDLQDLMKIGYKETHKKQYKILADPKNHDFIEKNIGELRKLVESEKS